MRTSKKLDDSLKRSLRLLADPITAGSGLGYLMRVTEDEGISPRHSVEVRQALAAVDRRVLSTAESDTLVSLTRDLDRHERRGRALEEQRVWRDKVSEARAWLERYLPRTVGWTPEDAEDVVVFKDRLNLQRHRDGLGEVKAVEFRGAAAEMLFKPRYISHCWNCKGKTPINSRLDPLCPDCLRYYRCHVCSACFHNAPYAPSSRELRRR
jgi:hypothetical protein